MDVASARAVKPLLDEVRLLLARDSLGEAAAAARRAVVIVPTHADLLAALARLELRLGDLDAHDHWLDRAIALRPDRLGWRVRAAVACPPMMRSLAEIERVRARAAERLDALCRAEGVIADPLQDVPTLTYHFAYHGQDDREINRQVWRVLRRLAPSLSYTAPLAPARGRKLRVAFFSAFFKQHTIGRLFGGLAARIDPSRFERVVVLTSAPDAPTTAAIGRVDRTVVVPRSVAGARIALAPLALDVLVYLDIGMEAFASYLAASRLARVQATTWGHPNTTGIDTVDAFVSMRDAEPDLDDPPYTERLYVQDAPNLYYPAVGVEPDVGRAELGLPRGRLYGCPQTLFKLHPEFDAALLGVLDRDPEGVLVLHEGTVPEWRTILLDRLEAARPGVSARVHWLRSMPRGRFIQTVAALDVMLDPFPFGGGNTTIEALGVGTPVVTLPPRYARGRLTYTFCKRSGWMDGVATDVDDYCRRAVALASPADAAAQRRAIRERARVLFEDDAGPRELESVLERMVEDHAAG